MSFKKLQWLFPIAVALHNGEEAIWMPGWSAAHFAHLPLHPPGTVGIRVALAVLTVAAFVVTDLSARKGPGSFWAYVMFGGIVTMLVNVFVPHIPATIIFWRYTPGVVTAVLINLPVMSFLAVQAVRDRWVVGWKAAAFGAGVPFAIGGMIATFFLWEQVIY
jgi:hypothetical protein